MHLKHVSPSSHPRVRLSLVTPVIFLLVADEEDGGAHKSHSLFHHTGFILQGHPMRQGSKPGQSLEIYARLAVGH